MGGTGQVIDVSVSLAGFETPPEVWTDPCGEDTEPYAEFYSIRDDRRYKTGEFEVLETVPYGPPGSTQYAVYDGDTVTYVDSTTWGGLVRTHVAWLTGCRDPLTGNVLLGGGPGSATSFWVPLVTQDTVVPALYGHLSAYLRPPVTTWPSVDRSFGWLYVNTPMDFRINPPSGVRLVATVTNITGSVTGTVAATPSEVTFSPGEPGGESVACSVEAATAAYSPSSPGCHYTYDHSSAISASSTFGTRTVLRWDVTTSSPAFGAHSLPTISYADVSVAEVQAVVCTGGGC